MNVHKNARTTRHSQLLMVRRVLDEKQPARRVAAELGISERTLRKWLARWRAGGEPALNDRSSAPARQLAAALEITDEIERLRRQRLSGPQIARRRGLPLSTVGGHPAPAGTRQAGRARAEATGWYAISARGRASWKSPPAADVVSCIVTSTNQQKGSRGTRPSRPGSPDPRC